MIMNKYIVNTEEEFWDMFEEKELELSNLFIDACFKFLEQNPKFTLSDIKKYDDILIISVFIRELDDYGEIMLNPLDILEILEENLITQEQYENYKICSKIKSTIESLKNEQKQ